MQHLRAGPSDTHDEQYTLVDSRFTVASARMQPLSMLFSVFLSISPNTRFDTTLAVPCIDYLNWDTGYWILDTGYWLLILDMGYWILDTGYWILSPGSWILGPGPGPGPGPGSWVLALVGPWQYHGLGPGNTNGAGGYYPSPTTPGTPLPVPRYRTSSFCTPCTVLNA